MLQAIVTTKKRRDDFFKLSMRSVKLILVAALLGIVSQAYCQSPGLEIPIELKRMQSEQIIQHKGYTVSHNREWLIPNWVAYELTIEECQGTVSRSGGFALDPDVTGRMATTYDYSGTGWDRGHMAPAADMKWDVEAMIESFYLSNICPQNNKLNGGLWLATENMARRWAERDGKVYIVCGPIVESGFKTIGDNKVAVPSFFFKVVLRNHGGEWYAIGFLFPNANCEGFLYDYSFPVDIIEDRTGLDFFSALPDSIECEVEKDFTIKDWNS